MDGLKYVTMGDNSVENSQIKIPKPHAYLPIIGRKSTKFQVNPMKDVHVGRVAETRSRTDGITHTRTDEGHFYSPPFPLRLRRVTIKNAEEKESIDL